MNRPLLGLLALLATPVLAQPLPDRVPVGDGNMTIGFELKTTDKGNGPNGRTSSHSLMDYIIPKPDASWSEAERAEVARWGDMSRAQKTAFFFKAYKGGYTANNFVVDQVRFPHMDKSVSWYGESLKIPHIEIRSNPFDSPREAMEAIKALRRAVPETIAYHMHLRFPDTGLAERAEAMTEYLRRASNAIWLRRADYSSKTDFVLKQADNQPMNANEVASALRKLRNPSTMGEIIGRRGLRVNRMNGEGSEKLIDIEFRGLMKDTGRLEKYLRSTAAVFGEGGEAATGPWKFNDSNPYANDRSLAIALERESKWSPSHLNKLVKEVEAARERYGVRTSLSGEDLATAVKRLATADNDAGKRTLLPSSFDFLFRPTEFDPGLPEGIGEEIEAKKKKYLRKLMALAERTHAGEFGRPGSADYKPISVATRTRRILHDFVNETYTDGNKTAKLFEWYETSLFKPEEIVERTERYRRESGKNRAEAYEARRSSGEAEGFARRRPTMDPFEEEVWRASDAMAELESVRSGALAALQEKLRAATTPEERAAIERGLVKVARARFVVDPSTEIFAETKGERVVVSQGLLNEVMRRAYRMRNFNRGGHALGARILGLIAGHELAHVSGITNERFSDRRGVEFLEKAKGPVADEVIRASVASFDRPIGSSHVDNLINRLKSFARYGTVGGRERAMRRAAAGEADRFAKFRRPDGTVDWAKASGRTALREGLGLANFGMALFLKELAVVAKSGDRARIEEFFDALATTEFYKHYGLFVLGARAGEVAYAKYLERFIKPRFVNSILKTNLILAAGLALPQIASGNFSGKAFVISLGSLGLSSTAVKTGVASLKWVVDLKKAKPAALARLGLGKVARVGGWFYHAAELAVVLYLAEEIEGRVNAYLDREAARDALADAGEKFLAANGSPDATPESLSAAAEAYNDAWTDYRDFLYNPLDQDEALFAGRLEKAAREAKILEDKRAAGLKNLERMPALRERMVAEHGSVENYVAVLTKKEEAEIDADIANAAKVYNRAREEHLAEIYEGNRRESPLLDDVDHMEWLALGARADDPAAPYTGRTSVFANLGRANLRRGLRGALEGASTNRLETYDDEDAVLAAAADALRARGREDLAASYDDLRKRVLRTRDMDRRLVRGGGMIEVGRGGGATEALEELGD